MIGLLGKKCGMTRIFQEGVAIPVTVVMVLPNRVTQLKKPETDGYAGIQITTGECKPSRLTKPMKDRFNKLKVAPGAITREFRVNKPEEIASFSVGSELLLEQFKVGQFVDVTGTTKGKGFAGTIKRHHFRSQDATHGNSRSHRVPGSIGQRQSPGKVFKGKKMSGQLGNAKRTILSQKIVSIDADKKLILIRGAVPGASNGYIIIRPAVKKSLG